MLRSALLSKLGAALIVAAALAAATPVAANSSDSEDVSHRSQLSGFAATLRQESSRLADAIADATGEAKPILEDWKTRTAKRLDSWRAALSGQKDTLATYSRDLDATLDGWKETANQTWLRLHAATRDVLDRFHAWLRGPSPPGHDDQFPI